MPEIEHEKIDREGVINRGGRVILGLMLGVPFAVCSCFVIYLLLSTKEELQTPIYYGAAIFLGISIWLIRKSIILIFYKEERDLFSSFELKLFFGIQAVAGIAVFTEKMIDKGPYFNLGFGLFLLFFIFGIMKYLKAYND